MGTFGPKGPENLGMRPKRVHWTTFYNVGAENGTFEPQKGLKSRGYTRAKKSVFWYPTLIPIFGGTHAPKSCNQTTKDSEDSLSMKSRRS